MNGNNQNTRLAFLVVNFGSSTLLARNLAPAVRECRPDVVVVVDCWSGEDERQRVTELSAAEGWDLVSLPDNRGFGGGMNAGAARARQLGATQLLLINPDARIDSSALDLLSTVAAEYPDALVAPRVVDAEGKTWFAGAVLHLSDGATSGRSARLPEATDGIWEWISGACMMLSMQLWDAVGGFDESYFLYWEDVDLSRRVTARGGRLIVVQEATVLHEEGGTHKDQVEGRGKSGTYYHYMIRNRLMFATKHLDAEGIRRWRRASVTNAWAVLLQGGRRQFLHPVAPARAAWRGLREGMALAAFALKNDGSERQT
ncbi:glycosyltransferase family 2 protein [Tessaracoccus antarcticus]|uniref:Glycosyltransferase family 2 protein n=1 Tax=Tessaracoccus antarcticus TaxID=2479848 RepID=A0A3M0G0J9_9ACTN|nr:glycosyltransferase family 2 protein [Tessaracoccus antarcticus]